MHRVAPAKKLNGNKPATQHDLSLTSGQLQQQINELKKGQSDLKKGQNDLKKGQKDLVSKSGRLERSVKAILNVVQENNILLKEIRRLPERVARLERSVFR